jgi:hypothetical protein
MPPRRRDEGGPDIGREILVYLLEHPHAQDTCSGIQQWWLAGRGVDCDPPDVQIAIEDLVRRDLLVEIHATDARVHYRLNAARQREITAMLSD